ncbi:MAG: FtsX-like permease family protein [Akkermansiaceae bacterium]|nr:FtsX-like permease family protein [Akkermansiaceae bacterium]
MTLRKLVTLELAYRKLNFLLAVAAIAAAAATFLLTGALLKSNDLGTEAMVTAKVEETGREMDRLEDEMRKSMKGLGFNIYVFPEGQDLGEVHDQGYASKTMPEEYVDRLANSKVVTINHLLPALTRKLLWPESKRTIILIGIRGEVPLAHRNPMEPLIDPVKRGSIVLGSELHQSLGFKEGDKLSLMGREFTVSKCHPERGSKDDITAWINLAEVQEMLDQRGLINQIQALECNCTTVDRLAEIRKDLLAILPGVEIIEVGSQALARAEARMQAGVTAARQLASIKAHRTQLRAKLESLAELVLPLVALMGVAAVGVLTLLNVRERTPEIGLFLAIGVQSRTLLAAFLLKAVATGLAGVLLGVPAAALVLTALRGTLFHNHGISQLVTPSQVAAIVILLPVFAAMAAWLPSFWASRREPAEILRHD